jgi:hypothetical protein
MAAALFRAYRFVKGFHRVKGISILRSIERLPGGMMVVPLLIGAAIATFAPGTSKFFGSFTEALFNGALTILAVFYVCMGTTIELKATPYILKKGGALFITKIACAMIFGIILGHLLGEKPVAAGSLLRAIDTRHRCCDERHEWWALHGIDGQVRPGSGCGRLFRHVD